MQFSGIIVDLALILSLAGIVSLLCFLLKQPLVVGYMLAGILAGPYVTFIPTVQNTESIHVWAEIGIIFLFLTLGMEFNPTKYGQEGMKGAKIAILSTVITVIGGIFTSLVFKMPWTDAIVFAFAISISSTVLVVKTLDTFPNKASSLRPAAYSILIVEDLIGIIFIGWVLLAMAQKMAFVSLVESVLLIIACFGLYTLINNKKMLPKFDKMFLKIDQEVLFISLIGFCLGFSLIFFKFGLSAAIGAFIFGLVFGRISSLHVVSRSIQPLKNLFLAVFFVSVGMFADPVYIYNNFFKILGISIFVMFLKIVSVYWAAKLVKMGKNQAATLALSMSQVGEFSILMALVAIELNLINSNMHPTMIALSIVTSFMAPYLSKICIRYFPV